MSEAQEKKQYLLMLDEVGMAMLSRLCPSVQFVQVEGMKLDNNPGYQLLVNPLQPVPQEAQPEVAEKAPEEIPVDEIA